MLIGKYQNGNCAIALYDSGTKIRAFSGSNPEPEFPECIDLKITNYCEMNCPYCHEDSNINGLHGDINAPFLNTLHPYTEVALGGGDPLAHPHLESLLNKLKDKKVITNITINQTTFMTHFNYIKNLVTAKLIYGVGVSMIDPSIEFIEKIKEIPNAIVHTIAGIVTCGQLERLAGHDLKILILGYKKLQRGGEYYNKTIDNRIEGLSKHLTNFFSQFNSISFDNLAIKQLKIKDLYSEEQWTEWYMGDDGEFTMYIDLVQNEYAISSTHSLRKSTTEDIKDMFKDVRNQRLFNKNYNFEVGF